VCKLFTTELSETAEIFLSKSIETAYPLTDSTSVISVLSVVKYFERMDE
jgi:hypothetical protein